mgnify:CR=1 FL=1
MAIQPSESNHQLPKMAQSPSQYMMYSMGKSKPTSYQLRLAGLGEVTVNSFAESISESKINRKVEESVVMQDFFNPAQNLFKKWGNGQQNSVHEAVRTQT